jgi:hypothetical protein
MTHEEVKAEAELKLQTMYEKLLKTKHDADIGKITHIEALNVFQDAIKKYKINISEVADDQHGKGNHKA